MNIFFLKVFIVRHICNFVSSLQLEGGKSGVSEQCDIVRIWLHKMVKGTTWSQ